MNSLSIFIVEDEIITAKSIAKNIRKFGYQLAGIATSSSEAIFKILKTKPDLILIDIFLDKSGIDGIAVAQKIQSHLEVPILYLTAHSDRATLERAKITTPFGYILKPYSSKNLQINIELALHKHQQDRQVFKREKTLAKVFNETKDGVLAIDTENRVIDMNPSAQDLTKSKFDPTQNDYTAEIIPLVDEQTQEISTPIQELLEQGEVIYLEDSAVLLKKASKTTQVSHSGASIIDQHQPITESILIITRSKSEINSSKSGLATNNLLLKDLRTYLNDIILYELRTPLTVILSTAQSLESYRQKWSSEKQDKSLRRIQQSVSQIKDLLDNVAIWEELKNDEIIINPDWVNLVTLSENIIDDLKLVNAIEHELFLSICGNKRMVWLDENVLRCILVNLLLNSLKYSKKGTAVTLSLEFRSDIVIIQVSDRGLGIPLRERERIFEPFYRASNAKKIKGMGLGLAIVKAYVRLCGGNISSSSKVQSETIFTVSLPLKE